MTKTFIKSGASTRIGTEDGGSDAVPIRDDRIGTRISDVSDVLGSRIAASEAMHVSSATLQRYIRGENMPPFDVAARLCRAANVRMEWLATGEGEMRVNPRETASDSASQTLRLDAETLESSLAAVEAGLDVLDVDLEAGDKARLVMIVYRRLVERRLEPAEVVRTVLQAVKDAVNR